VLQSKGLTKLSAEIRKINSFAQLLHKKEKQDQVIQFLICLDFLVKGVLIHGQIKMSEKNSSSEALTLSGDTKFPILLGD
jgi:hypothetical protein